MAAVVSTVEVSTVAVVEGRSGFIESWQDLNDCL
jgi:hypothetical protein